MVRYARLYWEFFKMHIKVMMEYRIDFLIGILSVFLIQGTSIFFVAIVFDHIEALHGWTFYQILFIYGIAQTGRALEFIFFDNLWVLGQNYIRPGQFDRILIRPVNPLFHVLADRVQADGVGQVLMGLIVLITAMVNLPIEWGISELLLLVLMIVSSGAIFMAVNLFFASLSFWIVDSIPIMGAVFTLSDFTRYPMSIYNRSVKFVLTWLIPYGFTAFYPATLFIENSEYTMIGLLSPVVAIISVTIAYQVWKKGLKAFSSTGS
ncbi:ABC-2 family transporter protein [Paenibacillus oenotherae]|uniref:ABC-2 family transporter protein n=1 Tax=Paenibacillus oenotherae TaxID=1435645 RepID=A0ABS7DBE4_9BACL|nr:ABC-2 family transporter protein [Paenibacillus oenotherae]MBW7477259.1 ABC-2 family transporter protein [Paenibacillus oenotherae]